MFSIRSLLSVAAIAVAGVSALPGNFTSDLAVRQSAPAPGQGTFDGFFYSFFTTSGFDVILTNIAGGQFEVQWSGSGDFVAGQGFNPGSTSKVINFGGSFSPNSASASLLSVYGWSTNPLVEYYINEDSNNFNLATANPGTTHKGTVTSDGSVYDIYEHQQVNQPSIQGTATFQQYLSVRQSKRTSGTVTVANHVKAWAALGMPLGTMNYQILAVEGLSSSGAATLTVS
ncbi:concanavalin A-like lectin/glucanase domain-containing protein [Mycena rosella]|uniref:Endo-1,4-beta-xylanase n=1 Tax=Mycena rosella TaxID=1033263 RepID=A0AAD7G4A0_MYCRO|nr:concanavalin A-like lectin/glucanase domain-containing protein [Mycena rosella]